MLGVDVLGVDIVGVGDVGLVVVGVTGAGAEPGAAFGLAGVLLLGVLTATGVASAVRPTVAEKVQSLLLGVAASAVAAGAASLVAL